MFIINWQFILVLIYGLGTIECIQVLVSDEIQCFRITKVMFIEQIIQQ